MARGGITIEVAGSYNDRDIKRAQRDLAALGDAAGGASTTFSDRFAEMGASMAAFGATMTKRVTLPLVAAGGAMFALFTKQEDAIARMNGALRANGGQANVTADEIMDLAASLQKTTTFGDEATISAAGLLLTFHRVRNEFGEGNRVFDRTLIAAQNLSAALGTDLESATMQLAKAMENPTRGMTALARSGTTFTDQQRDMIKTMEESGDILGAQKAILEVVESQYGGMAETMATTSSGKIKQAFNELGDAGEGFGEIIAEVVNKVADGMKRIGEFFKGLSPEMKELIVTGAAILAAIGPVLLIVGKLMGLIVALKGIFLGLAAAVSAPVLIVVGIIAALVAGVVIAWKRSERFRDAVTRAWNDIREAAVTAWNDFLKPAIDDLVAAFENHIIPAVDEVAAKFNEAWPGIRDAVLSFWGYVQPVLGFLVTIISNVIVPALAWLLKTAITVWTGFATQVSNAWTRVFQPAFSWIANFVRNTIIPGFQRFLGIARTVWDGVSGAISSAWDFISGVFDSIKSGIASVADWVGDKAGAIGGFFSGMADGIKSAFRGAFNFVANAWNNTVGKINFTFPSWLPGDLGGKNIGVPNIPTFDKGGIVPGIPGEAQLAIVHAGEMILRQSQIDQYQGGQGPGSAATYNITINGLVGRDKRDVLEFLARELPVAAARSSRSFA